MKTLISLFRKILGFKKTEAEMTIDEYIASVQNRKQQLSNISSMAYARSENPNNDLEASGNLVLV